MRPQLLIFGAEHIFLMRWNNQQKNHREISGFQPEMGVMSHGRSEMRFKSPRTLLQFIRTFRLKKLAHGESVGTNPTYTMWVIIHY